jgi:cell division transport system ATP-binding protein
MIELWNVNKTYETGNKALRNINITVEDGEFVFIIGRSGSGKSTLLKLLLKEVEPTSGKIIVNDMNLGKMPRRYIPKYRRRLGMIFQDFRLLKDRNVYENVAFAQRVIGASARSIRESVPTMLTMVGLSSKYKFYPQQLSGGEQQRVAIARALIKNPKLLLCDEPTGALDSKTSKDILVLLEEINQKYGMTMLIVTHNNSIKDMVHKVIRIKDGQISREYENESRIPASELEEL